MKFACLILLIAMLAIGSCTEVTVNGSGGSSQGGNAQGGDGGSGGNAQNEGSK